MNEETSSTLALPCPEEASPNNGKKKEKPVKKEPKEKGFFGLLFGLIFGLIYLFFRITWFFIFWGLAISFIAAFTIYTGPICTYPNECGLATALIPSPAQGEKTPSSDTYKNITKQYPAYSRLHNSTYLNYPKSYIQYNAKEYADFIATNPIYQYPYLSTIMQFWQGYCAVYGLSKGSEPVSIVDAFTRNYDDNVNALLTGTILTIENLAAGVFENTVGRYVETKQRKKTAPMVPYAEQMAKEYADFSSSHPWYQYPFWDKLKEMYKDQPIMPFYSFRNIERKIHVSISYSFKALCAAGIQWGNQHYFKNTNQTTYAIIDNGSQALFQENPSIKMVQSFDDKTYLITLPRYYEFTPTAIKLAEKGILFKEIAGNSQIFMTVIAPKDWKYAPTQGTLVFCQSVLSRPDFKRIAIKVPVNELGVIVRELNNPAVTIERIYDY